MEKQSVTKDLANKRIIIRRGFAADVAGVKNPDMPSTTQELVSRLL